MGRPCLPFCWLCYSLLESKTKQKPYSYPVGHQLLPVLLELSSTAFYSSSLMDAALIQALTTSCPQHGFQALKKKKKKQRKMSSSKIYMEIQFINKRDGEQGWG